MCRAVIPLVMTLASLAFAPAPLPRPDRGRGADVFPAGWSPSEIAEATPPYGADGHVHVLAWQVREDKRPLRVETCLVLKDLGKDDGHGRWCLAYLYRHPHLEAPAWQVPLVFPPPVRKGRAVPAVPEYCKRFTDRPGNEDVSRFLKGVRWKSRWDDDWKLLGGAVCARAWRSAIGEQPPSFADLGK